MDTERGQALLAFATQGLQVQPAMPARLATMDIQPVRIALNPHPPDSTMTAPPARQTTTRIQPVRTVQHPELATVTERVL